MPQSPLAGRSLVVSPVRARPYAEAWGAIVLAASIPFLFMHERFQASYGVPLGTTTVDVRLSDAAILAVLVAALVVGIREGFDPLRAGRLLWISGGLLLVWVAFETLRPASVHDAAFDDHVVSALKLAEYAALALAVPLLIRRTRDLTIFLWALILWSVLAVAVALLQLFGLDIFAASSSGSRSPSFLGRHDFASLSALAVSFGVACLLASRTRRETHRLFALALAGGVLGLILAGSVTAAAGLALGAVFAWAGARRRFSPTGRELLAVVAVVGVVTAGVFFIRSPTIDDFLGFLGVRHAQATGIQSYSQRTVLAYIGLRIFEDRPLIGAGWQRSSRPDVFEPYLADAHKRFPDVVAAAFPSPERLWGVQNLYVQMLADAGIIGFVLLLAVGAAGLILAARTAAHASTWWAVGVGLLALCALLTLAGTWASLGIVPGIPLQAATCLVLGLVVSGAATVEDETRG